MDVAALRAQTDSAGSPLTQAIDGQHERLASQSGPLHLRQDRDPIEVPPPGVGRDADVGGGLVTNPPEVELDPGDEPVGAEFEVAVAPKPGKGGAVDGDEPRTDLVGGG